MVKHRLKFISLLLLLQFLQACVPSPPENVENICAIFKAYPNWYRHARRTEKKWAVPVHVQMAIIYQESSFKGNARPPRKKLLWVIPWLRPSSAYGYCQALKGTWEEYQRSAGHYFSQRDDFAAASDFIGWYIDQAHKRTALPKNNAYLLYLAYHDGIGGYQRKTYLKKPWLMNTAKRVEARAGLYKWQLGRCYSASH